MLHRAGYATGAFIGAYPLDARFGLNAGFDVYDDNYGKGAASLDFSNQERPAGAVLEAAREVVELRTKASRAFCGCISTTRMRRIVRPSRSRREYASDPYLGEVAAVDHALDAQLAPIIDADPNALVIVTARSRRRARRSRRVDARPLRVRGDAQDSADRSRAGS